jgi:predicted MFS family arabinose efflux permease
MVAAAPPLASVALNTSVLYVGQATGSFVGGLFYARELLHGLGFVAMAFATVAVMLVIGSQPRPASTR